MMHDPVGQAAVVRVGHADEEPPAAGEAVTAADFLGRDGRVIQAAVDYVAGLDAGDADRVVEIGPGTFLMHDSLHLRSNVTVRGTPGRTVLLKAAAASSPLALDGDFGEEQITVSVPEGFEVGRGVAVWDDATRHFHVTVARITGRVAAATAGSATFTLDTPLRNDCMVKRGAVAATVFPVVSGVEVENVAIEQVEIDGNRDANPPLDGCRGAGIFLYRAPAARIHGCVVRRYDGDGISFQQSNDVVVTDTVCSDNAGHGLHPGSGSQRAVVKNCRAAGNGSDGMFVCWRVRHGSFENNAFVGNGRNGVSIGHKDTDNLLRGNLVQSNRGDGILFRDEIPGMSADRNRLEGNTIENNGTVGFNAAGSASDGPAAGIRIRGVTAGNQLLDNVIRDTRAPAERRQTIGVVIEEPAGDNLLGRNRIEAEEPVRDERRPRSP